MDALVPSVLIVDSKEEARRLLAKFLQRQGLRPTELTSGAEALPALRGNHSLLFVDVHLPDMDSMKLIQQIRKEHSSQEVKICVISEKADKGFIEQAAKAGGDAFLVKPLDPDAILQKLTVLVGQSATPHPWASVSYNASLHLSPILPEIKVIRVTSRGLVLSSSAAIQSGASVALESSRMAKVLDRENPVIPVIARRCLKEKPGFYLIDCELSPLVPEDQSHLLSMIRSS